MLRCPEENELGNICRNREFAGLQFIKTQKKIAKAIRKKDRDRDEYFSYQMLNRSLTVKSGIHGMPEPPKTVKDSAKWYAAKEKK